MDSQPPIKPSDTPSKTGDTDDENPEDWQAWQSEVRASAICDGEEVTGSAYLGGTWEKTGNVPEESNPEISGYEPQMTAEALEELQKLLPASEETLHAQISAALAHISSLN